MTMPLAGLDGPTLWMTISDVFHIHARGTVVTGRLEGNVPLNLGHTLVCDDGANWVVRARHGHRVLLRNGPPGNVLRGRTVT